MAAGSSYAAAVSAWTEHLRSGGTTPWSAWTARPEAADGSRSMLPDAIHLELLRRLNLASGPATGAEHRGLANLVLTTAAPGRGLVDVPLPWPEPPSFGTPPMSPEELPPEELVRLAVGVLTHLLPSVPTTDEERLPRPWPLPGRRRFRLHGSPSTASAIRRSLLHGRLAESDWRPTHVVIALPVDLMMLEHWATAVRHGAAVRWRTVWRRAQAADRLPRRLDVPAIAQRLHDERPGSVQVVAAADPAHAASLVARVLRTGGLDHAGTPGPALSDLLRRVNRQTALTHEPAGVRDLAGRLEAALGGGPAAAPGRAPTEPGSRLGVPAGALAWAREIATTTAADLARAGYPVHGDLRALAPARRRLPGTVDPKQTLELALTACLRTWQLGGDA